MAQLASDIDGLHLMLRSDQPGLVVAAIGHSNIRSSPYSQFAGDYGDGAGYQFGAYHEWPVDWGGLQVGVYDPDSTIEADYPVSYSWLSGGISRGVIQIGDTTNVLETPGGVAPMHRLRFTADIANNTDVAVFGFDPVAGAFPWRRAPQFEASDCEFLVGYWSGTSGNLADGAVRARARWDDGVNQSAYANANILWDTQGGEASGAILFQTVALAVANQVASGNGRPHLHMQTRLENESGAEAAFMVWLRKQSNAGLLHAGLGRGNFGVNTSLGSAPGNGWSDNTDQAGFAAFFTALRTASHHTLVPFFHSGPADVVSGPVVDEAQFIADHAAKIAQVTAAGLAAGFTSVRPVIVVDPAISAIDPDNHRQLERLLYETKQEVGASCGFVNLYRRTGRALFPSSYMIDARHWTPDGARFVARELWDALRGTTDGGRANRASRTSRTMRA